MCIFRFEILRLFTNWKYFMKNIFYLALTSVALSLPAFAGPIGSVGPAGQELLRCNGTLNLASGSTTEVEVSVAPHLVPGAGAALFAAVSLADSNRPTPLEK